MATIPEIKLMFQACLYRKDRATVCSCFYVIIDGEKMLWSVRGFGGSTDERRKSAMDAVKEKLGIPDDVYIDWRHPRKERRKVLRFDKQEFANKLASYGFHEDEITILSRRVFAYLRDAEQQRKAAQQILSDIVFKRLQPGDLLGFRFKREA